MKQSDIEAAIYQACLKAAEEFPGDIREMSWFKLGRSKADMKHLQKALQDDDQASA